MSGSEGMVKKSVLPQFKGRITNAMRLYCSIYALAHMLQGPRSSGASASPCCDILPCSSAEHAFAKPLSCFALQRSSTSCLPTLAASACSRSKLYLHANNLRPHCVRHVRHTIRRLRPCTFMQIDANGDEEDPARLEEQRAKLDRLFKASSSVDSTIQMPSQAASSSPFDVYSNSSISQVSPQDPLQPPGNAFVRGAAGREMASDRVFEAGVAADQVADTMDQAMSQSHTAIVSAVLSGSRRLTVSVNVPELDRTSRGYNETALYAWSSRVAASMATLATSDAAVKVVVQDIHAAAAAAAVFQKCDASSALLAEGRLVIRTLSEAQSGAEVVSESDSAVLLVAPRNTKENKVTKEVRGILLALGLTGKLIVVLNQALDAPGPDGAPSGSMPVEMRRFEEVFHIQVWALQGKVQSRYQAKDRPLPQAPPEVPRARRVALTRVFPGEWSLYVFQEEDQRYQLLKTMDKKPSERLVLQICARLLSPK